MYPRLLLLSLISFASSTYAAVGKRQINFGVPSNFRAVNLPAATFAVSFPSFSIGSPVPGDKSAEVDFTGIIGDLVNANSGDSPVGIGDNSGSISSIASTHSSGSSFGTASGSVSGASDDQNNGIDASIASLHSDSGNNGLAGHGAASPISLNQQTTGTDLLSSSILNLLQNAGSGARGSVDSSVNANVIIAHSRRSLTREGRFLNRVRAANRNSDKRQATAGDVLSTVTGAAAALPQAPGAPAAALPQVPDAPAADVASSNS